MCQSLQQMWKTLCRKKKFECHESNEDVRLGRLNVVDVACFGLATVIGSGAYVYIPQAAKEFAGPSVVISVLVVAVTSCLAGLCYSELATIFPKGGSAYVYAYVTLGEMCAFILGWTMVLEYSLGTALAAKSCVQYLDVTLNGSLYSTLDSVLGKLKLSGLDEHYDLPSVAVVLLGAFLVTLALKVICFMNNALVVINLLVLSGIILIAAFNMDAENWTAGLGFFPNGASGVFQGASLCYFIFIGYDIMAISAGESNHRSKILPSAVSFVFLIGLLTTFATSIALTLFVPSAILESHGSLLEAFAARGVIGMQYFATVGASAGFLSATVASMFAHTRLLESLAKDGLIFSFLTNNTNHYASTITACIVSACLAFTCDTTSLVHATGLGTLSASVAVAIAVLRLRYSIVEPFPLDAGCFSRDSSLIEFRANAETQTARKDSTSNVSRSLVNDSNSVDYGSMQRRSLSVDYVNESFVTCFSDLSPHWRSTKSPNAKSAATATGLVAATMMIMVIMGVVTLHIPKVVSSSALWREAAATVLFVAVIVFAALICRQPRHSSKCPNRVPCIPFLPLCTIWMDVHLIVGLPYIAWLVFLVWVVIGIFVYFGYGLWNSHAREGHYSPDVSLLAMREDQDEEIFTGKLHNEETGNFSLLQTQENSG